jgi:hypothetical protein
MEIPSLRGRVAQRAHVGLPEGTVEEDAVLLTEDEVLLEHLSCARWG